MFRQLIWQVKVYFVMPKAALRRLKVFIPTWLSNHLVSIICSTLLVGGVFFGAKYDADFRAVLEQGFQHRVELGDLASSVQQLKRGLEVPRILDPAYFKALAERSKELESKLKAQVSAGRLADLTLPTKELQQIISMEDTFERLALSVAQVERAQALKLALRVSDSNDFPSMKKITLLIDSYVQAASALRNSSSTLAALKNFSEASMGLGENLAPALTDARRKGAPPVWRDLLAVLGAEKADSIDRFLADARSIDEFQSVRGKAISKLEQVGAKVDGAERMLLQARSAGGLLVVASLLTWGGVFFGLAGLVFSARSKQLRMRDQHVADSQLNDLTEPRSVLAETSGPPGRVTGAPFALQSVSESTLHVANEQPGFQFEDLKKLDLDQASAEVLTPSKIGSPTVSNVDNDPITSGYWISAGSMVERRVALLDRQSEQLERHVKSVMASAESLAGRADLVLQSLHLIGDTQPAVMGADIVTLEQRVEELQTLSMNLALQAPNVDLNEPLLDYLERFNDELGKLSEEIRVMSAPDSHDTSQMRRVQSSIDEGRRLSAAADSLRERTETLYEDAQRFRRHSEALIRGIQDGAISDVPSSALKPSLISN